MGDGAPLPSDLMYTKFGVLHATDTIREAMRAMEEWRREQVRAVVEQNEGGKLHYYLYVADELYTRLQRFTRPGWERMRLSEVLELHEYDSVEQIQARKPMPADLRGPAVVIKGKKMVGYLVETDLPKSRGGSQTSLPPFEIPLSGTLKGDWDTHDMSTVPRDEPGTTKSYEPGQKAKKSGSKRRAKPPDRGNRGAAASMTYVPRSRSLGPNGGPSSPPAEQEPAAGTKDFKAYPRLDILKEGKPPKTVKPGDELKITAGFRMDMDAAISETGAIAVRDVQEGDTCLLHFFLKGLALTPPSQFENSERPHWELPLEPTATVPEFGVTVLDGASEVECKVEYYVRGVLGGIARRKLDLAGTGIRTPRANPCKFNLAEAEPVDLTVSITHSRDGHLEFVFSGAAVGAQPVRCAAKSDMPDSLELARDLYDTLKGIDFRDTAARDTLDAVGQRIQQLLPDDFFVYLREAQALPKPPGRTVPTLLLLSDEAYIPWELTHFEDPGALFDENAPPYLGAQTIMGRWIPRDYIRMPPAAVCEVRKFQVFASTYVASAIRQRELKAAVEEQEKLLAEYADWNPEAYQARESDFNKVKADRTEGKAVHFAVHGVSNPAANRQELILEDARVSPLSVIGAYHCGQTPRFSFVFMNACQVGIPGKVIGEVGGFPGELVRGGAYGVIAPLWDVHDDVAQDCAMAFYKAVFKEGKSVAEALRERRATYKCDSTTPVAYVFYGHPGLKLRKAASNG
jgi:hypothetical protein